MRYRDRIDTQRSRNPCLTALWEYLTRQTPSKKCRLVALDFCQGAELPSCSELAASDLEARLRFNGSQDGNVQDTEKQHLGQLLIVEDISPELIESIGSRLDVDPWFFASYVHRSWRSTRYATPQNCFLPSRERSQNFLPLYYHRCLSFINSKPERNGFLRNSNQYRKVVLIQTTGPRVGLAQHDCAVLLKEMGSSWIGIILVDTPITHEYEFSHKTGISSVALPSEPFLGGPEDFSASGNWNAPKPGLETWRHQGMLDELVHHWTRETPNIFDASRPTLQALSYYPLKIVAAEWVNYISVMSFALKSHEASNISEDLQAELDKLSLSIRVLQGWRRRVLTSMEKINQLLRYLKLQEGSNSHSEDWDALREDYEFIKASIQEHANRLESMIPVATSFIQLVEGRRALLETANVSRLTVLALLFVPLSFVATIFSMSEKFGPGGSEFWVYFAVALPITLLVLLLAGIMGKMPGLNSLRWPRRFRFEKRLPI